jgi:hypothetical protein
VGLWILAVHGVADLVYNLFFLEGPIAIGTLLRDAVFPILLVGDFLVRRANRRLSAARSLSTADQPGK